MRATVDRPAVIDMESAVVDPFGLRVCSPRWPMPPVLLFMVADVAEALVGSVSLVSRGRLQSLSVGRDGVVVVMDEASGESFVFELFPAVFSDGQGPPIYVGVWPD